MVRLALVLVAVVASTAAGAPCPAGATTASFLKPRLAAGVRTLQLEDTSRPTPASGGFPELPSRRLPVEVWYPTAGAADKSVARDARLLHGRAFPLVVYSPGLIDGRLVDAYLAEHLARRGFIVAAIDFPLTSGSSLARGGPNLSDLQNQPGDVSFVIDDLLRRSRTRGEWLRGGIARRRIGLSGLSLGGGTTLLATYHPTLRDPRVRAALAFAPTACFFGDMFYQSAAPPLLLMQGDQDLLLSLAANGALAFARASRSPRTLVTLIHGTHTAFAGPVLYPSQTSYDTLGCSAIDRAPAAGNWTDGLGGPEEGIDPSPCTPSCASPLPANAPMQAVRQHDLATAAAAAFFEATLAHSRRGRCFLSERLGAENADITVQSAAGAG